MKKWKEYNGSEKGMIITAVVLFLAVVLSLGRIENGFKKGMGFFFTPAQTSVDK